MKICIIVDDYLPTSTKVTAKMMRELSAEFIRLGHEVTVITPIPIIKNCKKIFKLENVTICLFQSGKIKNVSKLRRLFNEFFLAFNAMRTHKSFFKKNSHDLIIFWSPSIFWSMLVLKLKKIWGAPSYMLLRDFFPQWAIDSGILREKSFITKFFRYFERINYKAADFIALQSPKNVEWFSHFMGVNASLVLLYNWANDKPNLYIQRKYRKKLGLENKLVYFYGGNLGHAQDMMNIIRLAIRMRAQKNVQFVLVGAGDEFELVQKRIEKDDLTNITLLPSIPQSEFVLMLSEFDVGLFSLHKDHKTHNFPGKLLAYMVQGIPILGSINKENDLKEVIENAGAGFISINGSDDVFFENACKLQDKVLRKKMGLCSKKLLQSTFSVEVVANTILNYNSYK